MDGNAASVGVADQMNFSVALIDDVDGPCGFVRQRERMCADPGARLLTAVVLRRSDLVSRTQDLAELFPLSGSCARAMQGNHAAAVRRVHGGHHVGFHDSVLAAARNSSACNLASPAPSALTFPAMAERVRPDVLELAVAHRAKLRDRRVLDA